MAQPHYPNVLVVSCKLYGGNVKLHHQMLQYSCVQPRCCTSRSATVDIRRFLPLRLKVYDCFPIKAYVMSPDCTVVDTLSAFHFLYTVKVGIAREY